MKVESLVDVAKAGIPTASGWKLPIEAEITTGSDGKYEFTHLPVGARTFFYSAPGHDLAPATKDLVVVQDGLGAQLDVSLARPKLLRVRLGWSSTAPVTRFHLIPERWWPELRTTPVGRGPSLVDFDGIGGPFRRGLIAISGPGESAVLRVIGRYDIDKRSDINLPQPGDPASRYDVPEAACLEPLNEPLSPVVARFYAAISPIPLLWRQEATPASFGLPIAELARLLASHNEHGPLRGFALNPFLPVLVRSQWEDVLLWANEASEFETSSFPHGFYRARSIDVLGRASFASGGWVSSAASRTLPARLRSKLDLDEPDSREISGFVRWESGTPSPKATVLIQNAADFRRFLRRAQTDENGYFRFASVPGGEPYFTFALPPGEEAALRELDHFVVPNYQREVIRELTLHPHRLTGRIDDERGRSLCQVIRVVGGKEQIIWSFRSESKGQFSVANVPHGRYFIQLKTGDRKTVFRSLPVVIEHGRPEAVVRWPSTHEPEESTVPGRS